MSEYADLAATLRDRRDHLVRVSRGEMPATFTTTPAAHSRLAMSFAIFATIVEGRRS